MKCCKNCDHRGYPTGSVDAVHDDGGKARFGMFEVLFCARDISKEKNKVLRPDYVCSDYEHTHKIGELAL